jgi:acyl dehydratase
VAAEVRELDSAPGLLHLYGRVLLGAALPGGGDELPATVLKVEEVEVDRGHLAAYNRVCGFPVRDELPPTYPHVVAFPLAMAIMTDRSFPFRVLGLVHVANRIEQRRPVRVDEPLGLRVWAEGLRPHPRGRQFDLAAEAELDGEVAWSERSTYLRRGDGEEGASEPGPAEGPPPSEATARWKVGGDVGRRYAGVSGDRNPIHLHPLTARVFGFPGAIAHGMWMKARCLAALEGRLPEALVAEARFRAPLPVPGEVRFASRPADGGWTFALLPPEGERPHLTGSVRPR